jgi:hypothetical protein
MILNLLNRAVWNLIERLNGERTKAPTFVTSQKLMVKRLNIPAESSGNFFQSGQLLGALNCKFWPY